jgi:hypothetical protein
MPDVSIGSWTVCTFIMAVSALVFAFANVISLYELAAMFCSWTGGICICELRRKVLGES